jgi:predicted SnoaL-like aldol condensation-catalyzing enzyme
MSYKIKLSRSIIQRLNNYINSDCYRVDDLHLTEHWDNWTKKNKLLLKMTTF